MVSYPFVKFLLKNFAVTGPKEYPKIHVLILLHTRLIKFRNVWTLYTYFDKSVFSVWIVANGYKTLTLKYVLGEGSSLVCGTDDHGSGTQMETTFL